MKPIKSALSLLLAAVLLCGLCYGAGQSLSGYQDVDRNAWYYPYVTTAVSRGIMKGQSDTRFGVDETVTLAQTITMAARMHRIYFFGRDDLKNGKDVWYSTYVAYAKTWGLISENYTAAQLSQPVSRGDFAVILSAAYPDAALTAVNTPVQFADVNRRDNCCSAVNRLYLAGIVTGSNGKYQPDSSIKRCEAAAIVSRMVDPSLRQTAGGFRFLRPEYTVARGDKLTVTMTGGTGKVTFTLSGTGAKISKTEGSSAVVTASAVCSCTLTAVDGSGNTATALLSCIDEKQKGESIDEAVKNGSLSLGVTVNSIRKAVITVTNNSTSTVSFHIPVGSYFEPMNRRYQRMLIVSPCSGSLKAKGQVAITVDVVCMDFNCQLPDDTVDYFLTVSSRGTEAVLAQYFLTKTKLSFAVRQAAIWIARDDVTYVECGTLVSTIKGKDGTLTNERTINQADYDAAKELCNTLFQ